LYLCFHGLVVISPEGLRFGTKTGASKIGVKLVVISPEGLRFGTLAILSVIYGALAS
jgi:hypothetical protein